jgi:hypothetical protein
MELSMPVKAAKCFQAAGDLRKAARIYAEYKNPVRACARMHALFNEYCLHMCVRARVFVFCFFISYIIYMNQIHIIQIYIYVCIFTHTHAHIYIHCMYI